MTRRAAGGVLALVTALSLGGSHAASAQTRTARVPIEINATIGGGVAQSIFFSAGDRELLTTAVTIGWFVGDPPPPGDRPGGFEILVEFVPTLVVYQSEPVWGAGILPIGFRWTSRRQRMAPYVEWAAGLISMRAPVPEGTASRNFVTHLGVGLRMPAASALDVLLAYRLHHISNGNTVERNPGVNSHTVQVGVAWRLRRNERPLS